jgi:uracil phosphoribosyltransferase
MQYILTEHNSIGNNFIAEIRDAEIQKDPMRFRRNLERIGALLGYELSKTLQFESIQVQTQLGISDMQIPEQNIVLGAILRAGLPLHQGLLNIFDRAENAFISAYRKHHRDGTFEINLDYITCPNLENKVLILADPMLATGASLHITLKEMEKFAKPKSIHIVTAIASRYGLEYIQRKHPHVHIWMGALDEELTAKSYIVPGLGDAGDLAYGKKIQE